MIFIHPNIKVDNSPIHNLGVFCTDDIPKDTIIERCYYIKLFKGKNGLDYNIKEYVFTYPKQGKKYTVVFGYGSIYNHSLEPNIRWEYDKKELVFKTIRDVKKGEELLHNYIESHTIK